MAKLLGILISFLLLSSTAFSQQGTIVLDYSIAKEIATDLVKGDSAAAELKVVNRTVNILQAQLVVRENEVNMLKDKEGNYKEQIGGYKQMGEQYELIVDGLKGENRSLKKQVKLLGLTVSFTTALAVGALLLR